MLFALLLIQSALAEGPPGSTVAGAGHDCVFYVGPKADIGYNHVTAECYWPEITVAKTDPILSDFGGHDRIFRACTVSDVTGQEGDFTLVHQVHVANGIKPREVLLKFKKNAVSGGYKYSWTMHENQPPPANRGHVTTAYDTGSFEVTHNPSGGIKVVYRLLYSPGGRVPKFLVNWFQTDGVRDIMEDLRVYLNR